MCQNIRWRLALVSLLLCGLALQALCGCEQSGSGAASAGNAPKPASGAPLSSSNPSGKSDDAGSQAPVSATSFESPVDKQFHAILSQVVDEDGYVKYSLLAGEAVHKQLNDVVAGYASAALPPESEAKARLALWCNAYNANAMKMALEESRKEGFKNVHEVSVFFDKQTITVAAESLTLDGLENRMRSLKDPRIHAALVFGAKSCPSLRPEPYTAERLDAQLDQACRDWLDDLRKNHVLRASIACSAIFEWKAKEFEVEPYGGVKGFLKRHAHPNGAIRDFMRAVPTVPVTTLAFDWSLNNAMEWTPPGAAASNPATQPQPSTDENASGAVRPQ